MNNDKMLFADDIKKACEVMRNGGIILYPTDTVWGIGCDATNSKALIVLLANENHLQRYVDDVPDVAYDLIEVATKPLTIVYDRGRNMCNELYAPDGSVGIRITHEEFSRQLCNAYRKPIVSTSANISGTPTPMTFEQISSEIKNGVDFIVSYRQNDATQQPSSVIKLSQNGIIKILRN